MELHVGLWSCGNEYWFGGEATWYVKLFLVQTESLFLKLQMSELYDNSIPFCIR